MAKRKDAARRKAAFQKARHEQRVSGGAQSAHNAEPAEDAPLTVRFTLRKLASWAVDYVISAGLLSVFYFCALAFYLDPATTDRGNLMLLCGVLTVLLLTVYFPVNSGGQTLGQRLLKVRVENRNGDARTYGQCFVRECVVKVACGPLFAVVSAVYYVAVGLAARRGAGTELPLDRLLHTRVVPA